MSPEEIRMRCLELVFARTRQPVAWVDAAQHAKPLESYVRFGVMPNFGKPVATHCSFCGKSQHEVSKLIAGPSVFICSECVEICNGLVETEKAA